MSAKKKSGQSSSRKATGKASESALTIGIVVLVLIVFGLIYWFLPRILTWGLSTWEYLFGLLGAGLALAALYIIVLAILFGTKRLAVLPKYWNVSLGIITFTFMVWGVLAFISSDLGGTFGKSIISNSPTSGVLRLAGLFILACLFMAPQRTWNAIIAIFKTIGKMIWYVLRTMFRAIKLAMASFNKKPAAEQNIPQEKIEIAPQISTIQQPSANHYNPINIGCNQTGTSGAHKIAPFSHGRGLAIASYQYSG